MSFFYGHRMELIFAFAALALTLAIWRSLHRMNCDPNVVFDLRDLLMENGRVSKAACVMMGAFAVTTWQFVFYSLNGKLTEGFFGLYAAAWIAPVVMRLISNKDGNSGATVTTETKTTLKA